MLPLGGACPGTAAPGGYTFWDEPGRESGGGAAWGGGAGACCCWTCCGCGGGGAAGPGGPGANGTPTGGPWPYMTCGGGAPGPKGGGGMPWRYPSSSCLSMSISRPISWPVCFRWPMKSIAERRRVGSARRRDSEGSATHLCSGSPTCSPSYPCLQAAGRAARQTDPSFPSASCALRACATPSAPANASTAWCRAPWEASATT